MEIQLRNEIKRKCLKENGRKNRQRRSNVHNDIEEMLDLPQSKRNANQTRTDIRTSISSNITKIQVAPTRDSMDAA